MPSRRREARSRKSSRPANGEGRLALGIDLGATKVVSALVDPAGHVVYRSDRFRHANDGPARVLEAVVRSARQCLDSTSDPPRTAGIAVAAQVDPKLGIVVYSPNLRWRDQPLGNPLSEALGIPVRTVNDARAATFAEWRFGAGIGERNLFCLVVGSGVGGSAVVDGRLLEGGTHSEGEVGHLTLVSGGRSCHCPNTGCFEAYVGGWAIADRAQEAVAAAPEEGAALVRLAGSSDAITAESVFHAADDRDPLAGKLVADTERYLADGAVSVVNAFNPTLLILAGGLAVARPGWVGVVETAVRSRCQPAAASARIVLAALGSDAGAVGAAQLSREPQRIPTTSRRRSRHQSR